MDRPLEPTKTPGYSKLVVDLDNTLVATDTLLESILLCLKANPFSILLLLGWVLKGKWHLKDQLAQRVCPDAASLPYRQEVIEYLGRAKDSGKTIILATAAHRRIAEKVAEHLGLFSAVLASDAGTNLAGPRKLQAILSQPGGETFAYIGDNVVDIPLWRAADTAVLVAPSAKLLKRLEGHPRVEIIRDERQREPLKIWIKALRLHQWAKNLLVFLPAILAHRIQEPAIILPLILAFLSLSFNASAVYLLNDLLDLEADRQHLRKKYRPVAYGSFSVEWVLFLIPILLLTSYLIALAFLPLLFFYFLLLYLGLTSLYSFYLKPRIILDVTLLAALYTFRVIIGAIAVNLLVSSWLLAFSMFFFLSLALMKRYSELLITDEKVERIPGRGYLKFDAETIMASGITSGQLSLLVFALFMRSKSMEALYGKPDLLWFIIPVLFYWITRMWMLAHRGEMVEDPMVFTIKDRTSYVVVIIIGLILYAATQQLGSIIPVKFLFP